MTSTLELPESGVAFVADLPDEITLSSGTVRSRVQIAKTGTFQDPRYGKFKITTGDFDKWETNFQTFAKSNGRLGLPIDVDHSPEKQGKTEAAGWVVDLDRKGKNGKGTSPDELWATVEWNSLGQELVKDRRYAYLSPSYQHNYADETGKLHGTALVGVGLTNRPFLTMATVSLSESGYASPVVPEPQEVPETTEAYSHSVMTDLLDSLRKTLSLSQDADEAAVLAAANAAVEKANVPTPPVTDGVNLSELATAQGMVVLSATDHLTLATQAAQGAAAAEELKNTKFENAFKNAVSLGKVLPVMQSTFQLSYNADPEATLKSLDELPQVINVSSTGYTGNPADTSPQVPATTLAAANEENWGVDAERAELDRKATELSAAENIDYVVALERVMAG